MALCQDNLHERGPALLRLHFDNGTLIATGVPPDDATLTALLEHDPRTGVHRAAAQAYREVVLYLHRSGVEYEDAARRFARPE